MNLIYNFLGVDLQTVTHKEKIISSIGAFFGIFLVFYISDLFIGSNGAVLITASMGASAVLLFALPHGALSQPWAVIGGHIISAFVGVSIAKLVPDIILSAGIAVGLAILAMHYFKCIHPPGGATALVAVIGGHNVISMGYSFMLTPVAINIAIIILVAVIFNSFFAWRRYPAYLSKSNRNDIAKADIKAGQISHDDLVFAFREMDLLVDITEEDLLKIYELATQNRKTVK